MPRHQTYDDLFFYFVRGSFILGAVLMTLFAGAAAADVLFHFGWGFTWLAVYGAFATAVTSAVGSIAVKYLHRYYRRVREGGERPVIRSAGVSPPPRWKPSPRFLLAAIRALVIFAFPAIGLWLLNPDTGFPWQMIAVGLVLALGFETILYALRRSGVLGAGKTGRS